MGLFTGGMGKIGRSGNLDDDIAEVLITEEQLRARVAELGAAITRDYAGQDVLLVGALRGALIFMADLARQIRLPLEFDTVVLSSYTGTITTGAVTLLADLRSGVAGRHVLVVEDIVDTGLTLQFLLAYLRSKSPASLRVCALLVKDRAPTASPAADGLPTNSAPIADIATPDYLGFHIPDRFVVGYGLDYEQRYRNLPYVGALKPEVYEGE